MRTLIIFLIAVMFTLEYSYSQTFENEQTKKIFEQGEGAVDLPTGKMSYRQHLYTLNQDGYQLPISLTYSSNGLRLDESSGLFGLGWSLSAGGVVTRKVRGMPDEKRGGVLYEKIWERDKVTGESIDRGCSDGETDFFYASFGENQVAFILELNGSGEVVARCSEATNVKIEVGMSWNRDSVKSFIITDEKGVSYYFTEIEYSILAYERKIQGGFTGFPNFSSAWHLGKISPPSGRSIHFEYHDILRQESSGQTSFYSVDEQVETVQIEYEELTHNYMNYWDFRQRIEDEIDRVFFESKFSERDTIDSEVFDKDFTIYESINQIRASSFDLYDRLTSASKEMEKNQREKSFDEYAQRNLAVKKDGSYFLDPLKDRSYANLSSTIINDFGSRSVSERIIEDQASIRIQHKKTYYSSKLIKKIRGSNVELVFSLEENGLSEKGNSIITGVQINRFSKGINIPESYLSFKRVSAPCLTDKYLLKSISEHHYSSFLKNECEFTYYGEKECIGSGVDWWGYYNGRSDAIYWNDSKPFNNPALKRSSLNRMNLIFVEGVDLSEYWGDTLPMSPDTDKMKMLMLQEVSFTGGRKLQFDYERNKVRVYSGFFNYIPMFGDQAVYGEEISLPEFSAGGLRLKQQMSITGEDTLLTEYSYRGGYFDPSAAYTAVENLRTDVVYHWQALSFDKIPVFRPGNNGVWYSWVKVSKPGNGSVVHKYPNLPIQVRNFFYENPELAQYPELGRFLLEQYVFDESGGLISCKKNNYSVKKGSQEVEFIPNNYASYCFRFESHPFNKEGVSQRKRDPYYIDVMQALRMYPDKAMQIGEITIGSFLEKIKTYHNPYRDIYEPNIAPRINQNQEELDYRLSVGMDVRLSSQQEVGFDNLIVQDQYSFTMDAFSLLLKKHSDKITSNFKTEYVYGNDDLTVPIRTIKGVDSKYQVIQNKYLNSYASGTSVFGMDQKTLMAMRNKNMVHVPLESQVYWVDDKRYCQIGGAGITYKSFSKGESLFVMMDKRYVLEQSEPVWHSKEGGSLGVSWLPLVNQHSLLLQEEFLYDSSVCFPVVEYVKNHQEGKQSKQSFDVDNNRLGLVCSGGIDETNNKIAYKSLEWGEELSKLFVDYFGFEEIYLHYLFSDMEDLEMNHSRFSEIRSDFSTSPNWLEALEAYFLDYPVDQGDSSDILLILDGEASLSNEIYYCISYKNGLAESENTVSVSNDGMQQAVYRIRVKELPNYQSISKLTFKLPLDKDLYSALVIRESDERVFKAYSYEMSGRKISEYNESLRGFRFNYDKKGRLLTQKDHEGDLISFFDYSILGEHEGGLSVLFSSCIDTFGTPVMYKTSSRNTEVKVSIPSSIIGSMEMSIFTGGSWRIEGQSLWLGFSSMKGEGNQQVTILLQDMGANKADGANSRTGVFTVYGENGLEVKVNVSQDCVIDN